MKFKDFIEEKIEFKTKIWAFQQNISVTFLSPKAWDEHKKLKKEKECIGIVYYEEKSIFVKIISPFVMENDKMYVDINLQLKILMHEIGHLDQNKIDHGNLRGEEYVSQVYENAFTFFDQMAGVKKQFKEFLKEKDINWREITWN